VVLLLHWEIYLHPDEFYFPILDNKFYLIQDIHELLEDSEITLLDPDFSENELQEFGLTEKKLCSAVKRRKYKFINSISELLSEIKNRTNWRLHLFTSGTTGFPKKITHTLALITRAVKIAEDKSDNVWAFAYNPTHIAGLQVFFQAFFNCNSIINVFRFAKEEIYALIEKYQITNISTTPTFFRLLFPSDKSYNSVKRITSGGEKFESSITRDIFKTFPKAKVLNIYAATEFGTLLTTDGEVFTVPKNLSSKIKIENNVLYIHENLLSKSLSSINEWYDTGDLIEKTCEKPLSFRFVSRTDDIVNVGGYRVNLIEVEDMLKTHEGVKNCRVYSKDNRITGKIILCDVILIDNKLKEKDLIQFLQIKIQSFKLPRIFNFVDELELTRTRKIRR